MEEVFYKLKGQPFRLSPDHRFCYDHKCYAKARAYMAYAYMQAEGFVMITGRPGTGKTTLIGELIESLSDENVVTANLVCTQLHADDLLKVTAYDFGVDHQIVEKGELLQHLGILLRRWNREGRRALLIVDEAQDLSESAMEELRLLTNIQENGSPLLQIFLLGQPELRDLVLSPSMEQVHQRIVAASHLEALETDETEAYIIHRLKKVNWQGDPALSKTIFPLIHKFSEGVPRRINLICSRLFLHGTVEQRHHIGVEDLRAVIKELQSENLAAGTHFSEDDFRLDDDYDSPEVPQVTATPPSSASDTADSHNGIHQPPGISTSEHSEPVVAAKQEYLHAVGDETVLEFDTETGDPILNTPQKKDEVVALRPASTHSENARHSTEETPEILPEKQSQVHATAPTSVPEPEPEPTSAPAPEIENITPADTSQQVSGQHDSQNTPDAPESYPAPETNEFSTRDSIASKQTEPEPKPKRGYGLSVVLGTIFLALLLLVGWLALDRGLTSTDAWQQQIDQWLPSTGAYIQTTNQVQIGAT